MNLSTGRDYTEDLLITVDDGHVAVSDYLKAFDTVAHDVLI